MFEKSRKMKDITLKEVSLVDKPANKRPFLMFKRDGKSQADSLSKAKKKINIEIESDGTVGGTTIVINGDKIDKLKSFNFDFWQGQDAKAKVNASYSVLTEASDGFQRTETYYLAKTGDNPMDERIAKLIKKFFGDKEVKFEKSELDEATIVEIEKALTTINEYIDEFPTDLKAAVGLLAINAGQGYTQVIKQEDLEKAGAKLSKDTVNKLKAIISAAQALLPKEANDDGDSTKKNDSEIEKTVKLAEITKMIEELAERLKVVEGKPASTKKGINEGDEDKKKKKKSDDDEFRWKSLVGEAD